MKGWLFLLSVGVVSIGASAQVIQRSVVSSGAVRSSSGGIAMQGTISQPIIGIGVGTGHLVGHGFWHTATQSLSSIERSDPFPVRITPQPAATVATIDANCSSELAAVVLTAQGRQVAALAFVPDGSVRRAQLECSSLASGLYLVHLRCGSQQLFLPLMIAK